ncbi:hypothetical protein JXA40_01615 [bacterium]|nr:hypothetical protein [candidate division CSSED10-310 bacterium]
MDEHLKLVSEKNERLHQIALSLFRNGDSETAIRCWNKIRSVDPAFPEINRWLRSARLKAESSSTGVPPGNERWVFKTQLDLAEHYGHKLPNKTRFTFRSGGTLPVKRIRHRHIAYALLVGMALFFWISARNMRSYLLIQQPESGDISCYRGTFFPYGWEKIDTLKIGLSENWEQDLDDARLANSLIHGYKIRGADELDSTIIHLYKSLGKKALTIKTIEQQELAIYYFSRIEKAAYRNLVLNDLATAYVNLARLHYERGNRSQALKHVATARRYIPDFPGAEQLLSRIHPSF